MLKYRDMQNIGVKLPPGLTSNTVRDASIFERTDEF